MTVEVSKVLNYAVLMQGVEVSKVLDYVVLENMPTITVHGIAFDSFTNGLTATVHELIDGDIAYLWVGSDNGKKVISLTTGVWTTGQHNYFSFAKPSTIIRGSGDFVVDGFKEGYIINVAGSAKNDGQYIATSVNSSWIEVEGGITTEGVGALVTITSATLKTSKFRFFNFVAAVPKTDTTPVIPSYVERSDGGSFMEDGFTPEDSIHVWKGSNIGGYIVGFVTDDRITLKDSTFVVTKPEPSLITVEFEWAKRSEVINEGSGNNNTTATSWFAKVPFHSGITFTRPLPTQILFDGNCDDTACIWWNVRYCWATYLPWDAAFRSQMCLHSGGKPPPPIGWGTSSNSSTVYAGRVGEFANPFTGMPAPFNEIAFVANSGAWGFLSMVTGEVHEPEPASGSYNEKANIASYGATIVDAVTSSGPLHLSAIIRLTGVGSNVGIGTFAFTNRLSITNFLIAEQPAPQQNLLSLRWSDTGGASWSDSITQTMGEVGQGSTDISFRRLGMARNRVIELSWSGNAITALQGVFLDVIISDT